MKIKLAAGFVELGISCIWWDCGKYALLDRESKIWKFPEIVEALTEKRP